jgi:hypothetical protein
MEIAKKHSSLEIHGHKMLFLQLLNKNMDCYDWKSMFDIAWPDAMVFRHLLQNCPNMKSAFIPMDVWTNFEFLPRLDPHDLFPVMSKSWQNLQHLKLNLPWRSTEPRDNHWSSGQSPLMIICSQLPFLRFPTS